MVDCETSIKSVSIKLLLPNLVDVEVGGHNDLLGANRAQLAELILRHERLLLANLLEHSEHESLVLFQVIDENYLLADISIPILGLVFFVDIRVPLQNSIGLADPRVAINPFVVHRD